VGKKGSGDRVCLGGMMVGERVEGREGIGIGDRMGEGLHINCIGNFLIFGFLKV
jgi:hypothetical protein